MRLSIKRALALAVAALCAVAIAGCGGSDSNTTANATASDSGAKQSTAASAMKTASISTKQNDALGEILAGDKDHTVYLFEADKGGKSACDGACAAAWPPVIADGNPTAAGSAKSAKLGTIKRTDGSMQVTYAGHPLYYFAKDTDVEDAYGQGVEAFGAEWYVMSPAGTKVEGGGKKSSSDSSSSSSSSSSGSDSSSSSNYGY